MTHARTDSEMKMNAPVVGVKVEEAYQRNDPQPQISRHRGDSHVDPEGGDEDVALRLDDIG